MIYTILRTMAAGMLALFGLVMLLVNVLAGNLAAGIYWLVLCAFGALCFAPDPQDVDAMSQQGNDVDG